MSLHPTALMKRRLNIGVALILVAVSSWIFLVMFKTAVTDSEKYQALANRNQLGGIPINANRGSIYDKNGQILAQSATVFNIIFNPKMYRDNDAEVIDIDVLAKFLYDTLDVDQADIIKKSEISGSGEGYQTIAKKVNKPIADLVIEFANKNKLGSLTIEQDTKRYYPQNDLAASVIGFLDGDGAGQYGLEAYYDDYLAGVNGRTLSARDAMGGEIPYRNGKTFDAQNGNNLILTLDVTLQHYLEKELKEANQTHNVQNRACGIVMNAKTGAILAMATDPGFNLNSPAEIYDEMVLAKIAAVPLDEQRTSYITEREKQWKNKAITELYYPGSVFKVVTGSSALEEKTINLETTFHCSASCVVADRTFNCWTRNAHGSQNFVKAMTNSCNPAFIAIGQSLGGTLFSNYFAAYGLIGKTGIDLPGEVSSIYCPPERMGPVELASSSFGQTNKITPIQMITAYAAVINGGNVLTPYVVSKITDNSGNVIKTIQPDIKRQVISEETSAIMRDTLENVVSVKGESNAYVKGYKIGGKSGTSQKQDENNAQNRDDLYVSSYAAFAPADDPEIMVLVMVDTPSNGEYYGSIVAAPAVTNVLKQALPYLGYYPEFTQEELENMDITIPAVDGEDYEAARDTLEAQGLVCEIIGDGQTIVAQVPQRGNSIPRGGKVILYTNEGYTEEYATVPSLIGRKLYDVNQLVSNAGLNLKITGPATRPDSTLMLQNWEAGTKLPKGTIIEVLFIVKDQY